MLRVHVSLLSHTGLSRRCFVGIVSKNLKSSSRQQTARASLARSNVDTFAQAPPYGLGASEVVCAFSLEAPFCITLALAYFQCGHPVFACIIGRCDFLIDWIILRDQSCPVVDNSPYSKFSV